MLAVSVLNIPLQLAIVDNLSGEYPTCGTGSAEASDETAYVRKQRGMLVAVATDFAIDLGFVVAGVVAL